MLFVNMLQDLKPSNIAVNEDCELRVIIIVVVWLVDLLTFSFADLRLWLGQSYR